MRKQQFNILWEEFLQETDNFYHENKSKFPSVSYGEFIESYEDSEDICWEFILFLAVRGII